MYCDILKDLLNQIDRVLHGNNQLEENERKSLYSLMESLDSLIGTTQLQEEKKGGEAVLDAESANTLRYACDDFTKKCNEFLQNYQSGTDPAADKLLIPLSNITVPFASFSADLKKIAEDRENKKNITDVFLNTSWFEKLFLPNKNALKKPSKEYVPITGLSLSPVQYTVEDSYPAYKETLIKIGNAYKDHFTQVLGTEKHESAFDYKMSLIVTALKHYGAEKLITQLTRIPKVVESIERRLTLDDSMDVWRFKYIDDGVYEKEIERATDSSYYGELIEKKYDFPKETQTDIYNFFRHISVKPYQIGIKNEELELLTEQSRPFGFITRILMDLFQKVPKSPDGKNTIKDPLARDIYEKAMAIKSQGLAYLQGKGSVPTTEDYRTLFASMEKYMKEAPVFLEKTNKRSLSFFHAYDRLCEFATEVPLLKDMVRDASVVFKERMGEEFEKQYEILCCADTQSDQFKAAIQNALLLCTEYDYLREHYEKVFVTAMLRSPEFRQKQVDGAFTQIAMQEKGLENVSRAFDGICQKDRLSEIEKLRKIGMCLVIDDFADREMERNSRSQEAGSYVDKILYPSNPLNALIGDKGPLDEKQGKYVGLLADKILNCRSLKNALATYTSNDIGKLKADLRVTSAENKKNFRKLTASIYGTPQNIFHNMKKDEIGALLQQKKGDPSEYRAIAEGIRAVNTLACNVDGVQGKDLQPLYLALRAYVNSHDSSPFGKNDKARFNSAATLFANVGMMMAEQYPDMRHSVEKDFKVTMLRSESFRQRVYMNCITSFDQRNSIPAFRQNMMSIAADINNYLQRAEKSVVSTKKVDADGEKKLLQVFRNIEGGTGRQTII